MIVAVVGYRRFKDYDRFSEFMDAFLVQDDVEMIISGGAPGADQLADRYAKEHDIPLEVYPADWKKLGKRAEPVRNTQIVKRADVVIAFLSKKSKGTLDTIFKARKAGKRVIVKRV
jgi:hypothetical protein